LFEIICHPWTKFGELKIYIVNCRLRGNVVKVIERSLKVIAKVWNSDPAEPLSLSLSVASTPLQGDAERSAPAEPASPPPPILSPQVTASEAMVMLDVPSDIADAELLEIADTLVSLRAPPTQPPPPLPSQPPPNSASYPRPDLSSLVPSLQHVGSKQPNLFTDVSRE